MHQPPPQKSISFQDIYLVGMKVNGAFIIEISYKYSHVTKIRMATSRISIGNPVAKEWEPNGSKFECLRRGERRPSWVE